MCSDGYEMCDPAQYNNNVSAKRRRLCVVIVQYHVVKTARNAITILSYHTEMDRKFNFTIAVLRGTQSDIFEGRTG